MSDGHNNTGHGNAEHGEVEGRDAHQPDYSTAMESYEKAKKLGKKDKADEVLAGLNAKYNNNVPPKEMEKSLAALVNDSKPGVNYSDIAAAVATLGVSVAAPALAPGSKTCTSRTPPPGS